MKKLIPLLFIAGNIWAIPPVISPSSATVIVKGTQQFISVDTVTWSLAVGSTGTVSAGGLYTAPNSFQAKQVMAGCPLLPNDHIYNTRIDNLPVDANSATRIANILSGTTAYISFEVSFPENILSSSTPTTNEIFFYTTAQEGLYPIIPFPYVGTEGRAIPIDWGASDRHILGVSTNTCQAVELFKTYPAGYNPDCLDCTGQSGVKYGAMSYDLPGDRDAGYGSTDAAGLYIQPLALRYSELSGPGEINHALRFTMANGFNYSGFLWPGRNYASNCVDFTTCIPYGSRFRLKSSFSDSAFSPQGKKIIRALKNYGMFMADGGTTMHIQTMADAAADTTTWNTIFSEFGLVGGTLRPGQWQFDQVDESTLMVSSTSGKVNLTNIYQTPSNFAEVVATRISDSSSSTVRIAIQPVTLGTYNIPFQANSGAGISVMAGTPQFQIPYWVEGATTTTVTCSMSPSTGTLTTGCLYTAPATTFTMSTATITITPTADSTATIRFPIVIFPSNGIRYNVGGKSAFITNPVIPYDSVGNYGPDINGNYWWSDPIGTMTPWYAQDDSGFPQGAWPPGYPDVGLFYTARHGNSDAAWSAMVPNGLYTLTLGIADDSSSAAFDYTVDSNAGTFLVYNYPVTNIVLGGSAYTPGVITFPITVTDNNFYFAVRSIHDSSLTFLNMWSLTPGYTFSSKGLSGGVRITGGGRLQ